MSTPLAIAQCDEFLKGISDFFDVHTGEDGKNICFKHKIEHIGKTVYSIGIDLYLYEVTGDRSYFEKAYQRVKRIYPHLIQRGDTYVFHPEGNDKWNMTNRVIDGGAITDMLAIFLIKYGSEIPEEERLRINDAVEKSADTYLVKACIHKAPTNQRLWGATGLASAYLLEPKADRKEALLRSIDRSFKEMRADGSIPYVTEYEGYEDSSANDITTYYHSRHFVFAWYVLESIGELNDERLKLLLQGVDFLKAMYQANGDKCLELETKHWYFLSEYEVASNSYDAYAFLKAYEYTKDVVYARYAEIALNRLFAHRVRKDHGIDDHIGGVRNFQCPYFWNSHCVWLVRIAEILRALEGTEIASLGESVQHCKESGLINIRKQHYGVIIRGSKSPRHKTMGQRIGGGSLLYFGTAKDGYKDQMCVRRFPDHLILGNFHLYKFKRNPKSWITVSYKHFRALLFHVRVEFRAGDWGALLARLKIVIHESFSLFDHYSSAFACAVSMTNEPDSVTVGDGSLTVRDGSTGLFALKREYLLKEEYIEVVETLTGVRGVHARFYYVLPERSQQVHVETEGSYVRSQNKLVFREVNNTIAIRYTLPVAAGNSIA